METFFWKNAEEAIRRRVFPCAYVLLVQVGTQIFTTFLICQVFLTRKRFLPGPLQNKSIRKADASLRGGRILRVRTSEEED